MTKTSKPAAITFPVISKGVRRNAETGIEIRSSKLDIGGTEYTIYRTERNGTLSYWGTEESMHGARALATERVEMIREEVAEAHAEALEMNEAEEQRIAATIEADAAAVAELATEAGAPAMRPIRTLLSGAVHSAGKGYTQVGRDRLARAIAILEGTVTVPSDAEADAEAESFNARNPEGTRVMLTTGQRYGLRAKVSDRPATVFAEDNRAAVMVKIDGKGWSLEWCDSLRPLVGRDRP